MSPAPKKNKYWMLANFGKKLTYETPEALQEKVLEYFKFSMERGKFRPTSAGLTLYLGFASRSSLNDYIARNEEYSNIVLKARQFIESCYEGNLYTMSSSGAIFALKNMGWKDKTETETNSTVKVLTANIEIVPALASVISKSEKDVLE